MADPNGSLRDDPNDMSCGHAPRRDRTRVPAVILKSALVTVGAAGIAAWLGLALVHLGDRYKVGHVAGHWMALARYANEGTLYPPLSDGVRFGGTRHMPLAILLNAGAGRLTGEYLTAGKIVALILFATLLVLVFIVLRQLRCPWPVAVALVGLLPATNTGMLVGSTVGGDVLAVVLMLGALATITAATPRRARMWTVAAGALAGLAVASKLTGVWAALAVLSWLGLRRDWPQLAWFSAACASCAVVTLGVTQWASDGRFLTTFVTLTFAGTEDSVGWIRAPSQLVFFGSRDMAAVWMVAPFAVLGALAAGRFSALTLYHHALGWSLLLTLVVFTDIGAGLNQLLDLGVLTIVAVGYLFSCLSTERLGAVSLSTALALAIVWAGATGVRGFVPDVREAITSAQTGRIPPAYNPRPLAETIAPDDSLLAEDPGLPVLLGQTPIVLDAFMLRRLEQLKPEAVDILIRRIERREFDHVAMIIPLDEDDFWWQYYHFGLRVVRALRDAYVLDRHVDGYYIYRPGRS
jgi:xanthosine utilization system XapX-like protein